MSSLALRSAPIYQRGRVRLLQVVESLHTGAVENWLMRVFMAAVTNQRQYDWTFFCTLGHPGRLDEQIKRLGGKIIYSRHPLGDKRAFFSNLRRVLKEGHYDILHCHHDFVSAIYLVASLGIPFRKRIVHVHNTDEGIPTPSALKKFLLKEPMRKTCVHFADHVVGISKETLLRFTRDSQMKPGRDRVVYYGVDTSVFHEPIGSGEQFRTHLGLNADAKVLLFAGRMVSIKNPVFLVDVLSELSKKDPKAIAVFAGAGNLEQTVRELAAAKNISDKVRVLGWRDDVSKLMRLSDLLIFPRLEEPKEGLGLVLVEAQAAGLPVLASPSITSDVQVVPELFEFLPLAAGPEAWANKASELLSRDFISPQRALSLIESSQFSLDAGVSSLLSLYSDVAVHSPEGFHPLVAN